MCQARRLRLPILEDENGERRHTSLQPPHGVRIRRPHSGVPALAATLTVPWIPGACVGFILSGQQSRHVPSRGSPHHGDPTGIDRVPDRILPEPPKRAGFLVFLQQFRSPLIYILIIAAVVTAFLKEPVDTGVILAVVILNAAIGYFQEYRAEESVRALKKMVVPKARVIRNGSEREIDSADLVPGDVVIIPNGSAALV